MTGVVRGARTHTGCGRATCCRKSLHPSLLGCACRGARMRAAGATRARALCGPPPPSRCSSVVRLPPVPARLHKLRLSAPSVQEGSHSDKNWLRGCVHATLHGLACWTGRLRVGGRPPRGVSIHPGAGDWLPPEPLLLLAGVAAGKAGCCCAAPRCCRRRCCASKHAQRRQRGCCS